MESASEGAARGARVPSLTPQLLTCLGMPTPSSAALAIPAGNSPVARALRITTERTPLDRVLGGEHPAVPERGSFGGAMRIVSDPGLWFRGTYAAVADRLMERHPQVWLSLAGSRPARGRLTVNQRIATQFFVEGTGKARIAVLAGDADLQGMVRASRIKRRILALTVFGGLVATAVYAFTLFGPTI